MKWKCLTCRGTFEGASDRHSRCTLCGSNETMDCNAEPVPLQVIHGELSLGLDQVPFKPVQVVRLGVRQQGPVLRAEEVISNYMKAMRGRW